ncbi:hypothetical protein HaLaN_20267 [Haematococcus lacustris]|uniref:Uncharacterized protein n=1 Tax=Haematococcus lacustris TaxID=44745 RepID=A0A699ZL52_HAELA|nr:hypothetical protein HaLaN_20267 [Haematococcus lacustris]
MEPYSISDGDRVATKDQGSQAGKAVHQALGEGCNNSGREQLVAALPAQLDTQGWGVQQVGQGEGAAGQGQQAPGPKLHGAASDVTQQRWREVQQSKHKVNSSADLTT